MNNANDNIIEIAMLICGYMYLRHIISRRFGAILRAPELHARRVIFPPNFPASTNCADVTFRPPIKTRISVHQQNFFEEKYITSN